MLFTTRNENSVWSQDTVDASSAEPFSSPEPVVRLNIKPSGSWNENAAEPEGRRHRDCTWKASGTQGICPYALLLFSVSPRLSWPSWGAGRARVWRKVGPARRPRRLMTLPSQQGDPPSPTFCFSRERLVRFLKDTVRKVDSPRVARVGGWPFRPVCGYQAIFLRTNKWRNSVRKPTNSSALCAELLGTSKAPKHVVHFISLSSGYATQEWSPQSIGFLKSVENLQRA